jgi:hypothetical protein
MKCLISSRWLWIELNTQSETDQRPQGARFSAYPGIDGVCFSSWTARVRWIGRSFDSMPCLACRLHARSRRRDFEKWRGSQRDHRSHRSHASAELLTFRK